MTHDVIPVKEQLGAYNHLLLPNSTTIIDENKRF